ncbi:hypothetical protein Psuf_021370 [Phytohabitans suffuscus]|uniref:Uncharacterized protein n=1 Tax=Phytohabitans suffuscus TaxID=624315 RepID=A0A6F8YFB4_9ACTN|nr:hypothetical protein [Phytohabitans suffuscus]BCB84824.1 hypothetical protein Psuf_021370 [Phytohabitans suffuscus]
MSGATVVGLEAALTLVIAALVVSHQLTPVALVAALLCFTLAGATRLRTLWVAAAAMFVGWFSYGATGFWTGHIEDLFGDLGRVRGNVSTGVGERLVGDPLYQQMQYSRIGWTGLLCLAAAAGWLMVRRRRGAVLAAGLAAAPAVLMAVQSYGGEVVIRCALYASPVLAPLAAVAVAGAGRTLIRVSWKVGPALRVAAAFASVAVLLAMLTTTRGLNASFEHVTAAQVERARGCWRRPRTARGSAPSRRSARCRWPGSGRSSRSRCRRRAAAATCRPACWRRSGRTARPAPSTCT